MATAKCSYSNKFQSLVEDIIAEARRTAGPTDDVRANVLSRLDQLFSFPAASDIYDKVASLMPPYTPPEPIQPINPVSTEPPIESKPVPESVVTPTVTPQAQAQAQVQPKSTPTITTQSPKAKPITNRLTIETAKSTTPTKADISSADNVTAGVKRFFLGQPAAQKKMEGSFTTALTGLSVVKMDWEKGKFDYSPLEHLNDKMSNGLNELNYRIACYKVELANKLRALDSKPSLDVNELIDQGDAAFAMAINESIAAYETKIHNGEDINSESPSFAAYVMLHDFDALLDTLTPFIRVKSAHKNLDTIGRYEYVGPSVNHYRNYGETDASIGDLDGAMANILLKIAPEWEFDVNGNAIGPKVTTGAFGENIAVNTIGNSGFHAISGTLKHYLFYELGIKNKLCQDYIEKGANFDAEKSFDEFIAHCRSSYGKRSHEQDPHITYMLGKAYAMKQLLFAKDTPQSVRNMFASMLRKTEIPEYRGYKTINGNFMGVNLKSNYNDIQRRNLIRSLDSALTFFSMPVNFNAFKESVGLEIEQDSYDKYLVFTNDKCSFKLVPEAYFDEAHPTNNIGVKVEVLSGTDEDVDAFAREIVFQALQQVVPEDYNTCMGLSNHDWKEDYMPLINMIVTSGVPDYNWQVDKDKYKHRPTYNDFNAFITNISQRKSVIYGAETKTTVMNPSGAKLPTQTLTCLNYQAFSLINDFIKKPEAAGNENFLVKNSQILMHSQLRNEVSINGEIKSPSKLNVRELTQLAVLDDFVMPMLTSGKMYSQNATFADKGAHYLQGYDLNKVEINGEIFAEVVKKAINGDNDAIKKIKDVIFETRQARYSKIEKKVLADFSKAFGVEFKSLDQLNMSLIMANMSEKTLKAKFAAAKVDLPETIYFEKENDHVVLNNTLMDLCATYANRTAFEERVNFARNKFAQSCLANNVAIYKHLDPRIEALGEKSAYKNNGFYSSASGKLNFAKQDGTLCPMAEAYFLTDMLLSNEFNSIMIGEVFAHPNKAKDAHVSAGIGYAFDKANAEHKLVEGATETAFANFLYGKEDRLTNRIEASDELINEFNTWFANNPHDIDGYVSRKTWARYSEASRLIAQIKRTVIPGATVHPYIQGVLAGADIATEKFIKEGSDISMPLHTRVACIKDIPGMAWNIAGDEEKKLDSMDGSGYSSPIIAMLENFSLVDAAVNYNKKSIMADTDPETGRPTLLKWAVYGITNEVRRKSVNSDTSMDLVFKKMHNEDLGADFTEKAADKIMEIIRKRKDEGKVVAYKDYKTNSITPITKVEAKNGLIYINDSIDGVPCRSLADVDSIMGGAWCGWQSNGNDFEYSEDNIYAMTALVCENPEYKDKFVGYLVNKSAIKVGQVNLNEANKWVNEEPLTYFMMSTLYGGIQMDAEHDIDHDEVTEMTQMLSALIEDGHYVGNVADIYNTIGKTVSSRLGDFITAVNNDNRNDLYEILAKSLIKSFNGDKKDTLGLAQAFVREAQEAIKKYNEDKSPDKQFAFKIPFSAGTVSGAFIAEVSSMINKMGIKHKYDGTADVLNPSRSVIQYYSMDGRTMLFEEYMAKLRKKLGLNDSGQAIDPDFLLSPNAFAAKLKEDPSLLTKYEAAGLIETRIPSFEDTVITADNQVVKIKTWSDLDNIVTRNGNQPMRILTTAPRDLKQADFTVDVNGTTVSMYQFDSVRASFYMKNIKDFTKEAIMNDPVFASVVAYEGVNLTANEQAIENRLLDPTYTGTISSSDIKSYLKIKCQLVTQDTMRRIENNQPINNISFLGNNLTVTGHKYHNAQCIMGRFHGNKFMLRKGDNIADITDASFFENRLKERYDTPFFEGVNATDLYDVACFHGDVRFNIIGKDNVAELAAKIGGVITDTNGIERVNDAYYDSKGKFICKADGVTFKTIKTNKGDINFIITNEDSVNSVVHSSYFDLYKEFNWSNPANASFMYEAAKTGPKDAKRISVPSTMQNGRMLKITKEVFLSDAERQFKLLKDNNAETNSKTRAKMAQRMFEAFKQQLTCTGARIPTQAMQSFMAMDVIAYTDNEDNNCYVPQSQTFLQGSDYRVL